MATCSKIGGISGGNTSISGENWGVLAGTPVSQRKKTLAN